MWNPFLTAEERASIRRGGELMRAHSPVTYWLAHGFVIFCAIGCAVILATLLIAEAYGHALSLALFYASIHIVTCWFAARNIRRL